MTTPRVQRPAGMLLDNVAGVLLGIALTVLLFVWVLPETYQSVNLPSTPVPVRVAVVAAGWFVLAALLGYARPAEAWRWGMRLVIPSEVVFGIAGLLDNGVVGLLIALGVFAAVGVWGAAGAVAGARLRRSRTGG